MHSASAIEFTTSDPEKTVISYNYHTSEDFPIWAEIPKEVQKEISVE